VRFALIESNVVELPRWEIHSVECDHVIRAIRRGSFAAIVTAVSAEGLVLSDIYARQETGLEGEDSTIMPCCADADSRTLPVRGILIVAAS
jgi:hypothetical protein